MSIKYYNQSILLPSPVLELSLSLSLALLQLLGVYRTMVGVHCGSWLLPSSRDREG